MSVKGRESIDHYLYSNKGHLIIKNNELCLVNKVSFPLWIQEILGFGNSATRNVAAFIEKNSGTLFARDTIVESNEVIAKYNKVLEAHNRKCIVWWKKAKPIQALIIETVEKSIRKPSSTKSASFQSIPKPPSPSSSVSSSQEEQIREPDTIPTPAERPLPVPPNQLPPFPVIYTCDNSTPDVVLPPPPDVVPPPPSVTNAIPPPPPPLKPFIKAPYRVNLGNQPKKLPERKKDLKELLGDNLKLMNIPKEAKLDLVVKDPGDVEYDKEWDY